MNVVGIDINKVGKLLGQIVGIAIGIYLIVLLFSYFRRKLLVKVNPDKYLGPDTPADPELLPKSKEHYRSIAIKIYKALDGCGTDDEELEALIPSLTEEELKVVANHFKEYLKEVGKTECGNIVNWLKFDGREDLAEYFEVAGVKEGKATGWFCEWKC